MAAVTQEKYARLNCHDSASINTGVEEAAQTLGLSITGFTERIKLRDAAEACKKLRESDPNW